MCQRLFGSADCRPAPTQLLGGSDKASTGNCGEQDSLQPNTPQPSDTNETQESNITSKKTTVLIMVSSPKELQQVRYINNITRGAI